MQGVSYLFQNNFPSIAVKNIIRASTSEQFQHACQKLEPLLYTHKIITIKTTTTTTITIIIKEKLKKLKILNKNNYIIKIQELN
jgi:hypothetical protein